jgi:hypothetical protein
MLQRHRPPHAQLHSSCAPLCLCLCCCYNRSKRSKAAQQALRRSCWQRLLRACVLLLHKRCGGLRSIAGCACPLRSCLLLLT